MTETRTAIRTARNLLGDGKPDRAGELLREVLDREPENVEARYTLAVAQRHRHRWSEALASLDRVLAVRPGYGRAHQEVGYNLLGSRNYAGAGEAFERAVEADPSLLNSWKCLARLYGGRTDHARLGPVLDQIEYLEGLPGELLSVIGHLSEDRLDDAERICRQYVRLMDHWDRVLPGFVLRVRYEDVVAGLEGQVRRLLDFCGLPFEPACLEFHRTERSIRTPSAEQVRRPIYRSGLAQWRNYEPWLGPLKEALGAEVLRRYEDRP